MMMPVNIRFQHYQTREEVRCENHFAMLPLTLPLTKDVISGYAPIRRILNSKIKTAIFDVYATFCTILWGCAVFPRFIGKLIGDTVTAKFTCAFSNIPGPLKAKPITNKSGKISYLKYAKIFIVSNGRIGLNFTCVSTAGNFTLNVSCDESIYKTPQHIIDIWEDNIRSEI